MTMLDGLRGVFLKAFIYVPESEQGKLIKQWNKECDNVCKIKEELVHEEFYKNANAEQENSKPLTLNELRQMVDAHEWAWVEMNFGTIGWCKPFQKYPLSMKNVNSSYVTESDFERGFVKGAYRYKPKEAHDD